MNLQWLIVSREKLGIREQGEAKTREQGKGRREKLGNREKGEGNSGGHDHSYGCTLSIMSIQSISSITSAANHSFHKTQQELHAWLPLSLQ